MRFFSLLICSKQTLAYGTCITLIIPTVALNTNIPSIKTKINGLRAQLGREMANEKSAKSGQSTDELNSSS